MLGGGKIFFFFFPIIHCLLNINMLKNIFFILWDVLKKIDAKNKMGPDSV